jgi:hypothetical protein
MVSEGEAIRQSEGERTGNKESEAVGYWLCFPCHEKRKKEKTWVAIIGGGIIVAIVVGIFLYFKFKR